MVHIFRKKANYNSVVSEMHSLERGPLVEIISRFYDQTQGFVLLQNVHEYGHGTHSTYYVYLLKNAHTAVLLEERGRQGGEQRKCIEALVTYLSTFLNIYIQYIYSSPANDPH
jgi:hypothetical protein